MIVYPIASLKVKRPSGSQVTVGGLRSASLELQANVIRGAAVDDVNGVAWTTAKGGIIRWNISAESNAAPSDAGVSAALTSARRGELLEIEATLGDGRTVTGEAYMDQAERGGSFASPVITALPLVGSGPLAGLTT